VGAQLRHPWRPKLVLQVRDAKEYVTFGLKASGSQVLFYFYTNVDYPIVGAFFGEQALGLYRLAYEVVLEPVRIISAVVVDIAFPVFAKLRHEPERLIGQFISFTRLNLIAVMSYSAVVLIAAEDVLAVVFPDYAGAASAIRILCIVAVLRSISFVVPPLLDGMGRPERTFMYTLTAAIALPLAFVIGAAVLGPRLGFLSVAVAWAVGYPVAFAVLVFMALATLRWTFTAYFRSVMGVGACTLVAAVIAFAAHHWLLATLAAPARLAITAGIVVVTTGALLLVTQGYALRKPPRPSTP
jgi:O-antigen/teichoic acid export membrane protein